jgi:mannose-6-phosphate isomerase-like protein (cupin superfamily)
MSGFAIDPTTTYFHLDGGHAEAMPVDERFWPAVLSGERRLDGWLMGSYDHDPDMPGTHSEVHPEGDELHLCQAGSMSAVLEYDDGEELVNFAAGEVCLIPAGTWHRLEAKAPSRVLTITFGQGSQHRPSPNAS